MIIEIHPKISQLRDSRDSTRPFLDPEWLHPVVRCGTSSQNWFIAEANNWCSGSNIKQLSKIIEDHRRSSKIIKELALGTAHSMMLRFHSWNIRPWSIENEVETSGFGPFLKDLEFWQTALWCRPRLDTPPAPLTTSKTATKVGDCDG